MKTGNPTANVLSASVIGAAACLFLSHAAFAQSMARDGFWKGEDNPDSEYARFLKIKGDRGFLCTLDGKSSFAFRIIGDSITTPMNGMDHIQFFSGLPDVVISGEEKGEAYSDRFVPLVGETYPAICIEEEDAYPTAGIARGNGRKAVPTPRFRGGFFRGGPRDALGRAAAAILP